MSRRSLFGVALFSAWSAVAAAQTQVKPRVLLIVDTSGSMTEELTSTSQTGADGSGLMTDSTGLNVPDFGRGYSQTADVCTANTRGAASRMYAAKAAVSNVVNASGDVDWGLARYAGAYCDVDNYVPDDCNSNTAGSIAQNRCHIANSCCGDNKGAGDSCASGNTGNRDCRCAVDSDCQTDQKCITVPGRSAKTCVYPTKYPTQCASGANCVSGTCTAGHCVCANDGQCNTLEFCVGGECVTDLNLCVAGLDFNGNVVGAYGLTDSRGRADGTCRDHDVLPITYNGSCGTLGTNGSLTNGGCRSLYTCSADNECATTKGQTCKAITVLANSGAKACSCSVDSDCAADLPAAADGQKHTGFTCQNNFCTYTLTPCEGDSAKFIVDPIAPSPSNVLTWLNNKEDYTANTPAGKQPFLTAASPVDIWNVKDPELRSGGLTPLGGSLRSAATWYNNIKTANSDAQLACRPYITVLLTDGIDTCDANDGSVFTQSTQEDWGPPAAARKFVEETVAAARVINKVYVIGLSVSDTNDRARLNAVAAAGGTYPAKFASSQSDIEAALADILAESILFEKCNGVDDDCDGLIDEGFGVYQECTLGSPSCNAGRVTCSGSGQSTCATGYTCQTGFCVATCSAGQGVCLQNGVRQCQNNVAVCTAVAGTPGNENTTKCNKLDDDCNGIIDDCTPGSPDTCSCSGVCVPTPEICNNKDDDCVGGVDNNPIDVGLPCGTGKCAGTTECHAGGNLVCNGPAPDPVELCNGIDDDCDGVIDSFTEPCPPQSGQCDPGVRTCTAGSYGACTGIVNGSPEVCDGIDNNCDGTTDNNVTDGWVNMDCCPTGNLADCCTPGKYQCVGGGKQCVGGVVKGDEVCDGVDNDCNGVADDVTGIGGSCTDAGVNTTGTCKAAYVCTGTPGTGPKGLTCQQSVGPSAEVCNGEDDDCDGTADNNITTATDPRIGVEGGAPCMALPDGQKELPCMPGTTACVSGEVVCQGYVGPQPNLCDGVSRDCTGMANMNGDCPSGFECYQGNCVTPCSQGEFPCLGGFVCDPATLLCIPDVCNKANCAPGLICQLASDGSAECVDPCVNVTCPDQAKCELGVCKSQSCKSADHACPTGEICQGTPPTCVPDPCADKMCDTNQFCNVDGECEKICDGPCLDGTVCIGGMCVVDPCSGKNCAAGEVCVIQDGAGVCVESFCGNDCGSDGRVCCGATCRPDPCSTFQCAAGSTCQLDPSCKPQCTHSGPTTEVKIVGAGGGGFGCSTASGSTEASLTMLLLASFALGMAGRRRKVAPARVRKEGVN